MKLFRFCFLWESGLQANLRIILDSRTHMMKRVLVSTSFVLIYEGFIEIKLQK